MPRKATDNARVHRDLRFDQDDHQLGADVQALQHAYNVRVHRHPEWHLRPLVVDGDAGRQTIAKCREAGLALGLTMAAAGVNETAQATVRDPSIRTAEQLARAGRYKPKPAPAARPDVQGNRVVGGGAQQRLAEAMEEAAHLYYTGQSHRYYSQAGAYTVDHGITGERPGLRSDCSQWTAAMHWSAGLVDPSGQAFRGGFTGTLVAHGHPVGRMDLQVGYHVIYGPGVGHHVEMWLGDGRRTYRELAAIGHPLRDRTVGHGSPPVDFGDIDMIAGARFFRPLGL